MAAYQLNDLVSTILAGNAGTGVVSSLQYSLRLQELILGICAVTIGTVILPDLTGFAKKNLWENFNSLLIQSIKIMALIAIPVTFYSLAMGENIITLIFAGGKFNSESTKMTVEVFNFHIAGLFFIAVNRIISPAFYAQQNTKSPTIAGLINFAVNIALASILSIKFKGKGIALALTIASAANTLMLFIFLRKTKSIHVGNILKLAVLYAIKIAAFSVIAVVPVVLTKNYFIKFFSRNPRIISQGIPIFITAAIFGAIGLALLFISKDSLLKTAFEKISKQK